MSSVKAAGLPSFHSSLCYVVLQRSHKKLKVACSAKDEAANYFSVCYGGRGLQLGQNQEPPNFSKF